MSLLEDLQCAGTETVDRCNACQSTQCTPDHRFERLLFLPRPFGVQRCSHCGLRWLSPRPSPDGCRVLYSDRYYFSPSDLPDYETFAEQRQSALDSRIHDMIATWQVSSILDFGAATGSFVAAARRAGIQADGIELSADARAHAHDRHQVRLYSPEEFEYLNERFDAIHMNHVFEHVPDPSEHLRWCFERLNSGGGIVIEVPQQIHNDADRFRRLLHKNRARTSFDAFSVHHTYFFNPRSLRHLVESAGFTVERLSTTTAPLHGEANFRRKLFWQAARLTSKLHYGGDTIELWARKAS